MQETNCHPFRHGNWLFVHNGEVDGIELIRKQLITAISDDLFPQVLGTTDSEVMFYLALTLGLESDPLGALARMAGFVEQAGRRKGIQETLWMTLGASDGKNLYAVRYASDGNAPTLYYSRSPEDVYRDHPDLRGRFSPKTRFVVSETAGQHEDCWVSVPQSSCLRVSAGDVEVTPFTPVSPGS